MNTTRAARITAASSLRAQFLTYCPRKWLARVLPSPYSPSGLDLGKGYISSHLESPCHAFAHCRGFAPAAPRRARVLVSVPFSGLLLSQPVRITGLVSRYLTNSLIRRRLILWRPKALRNGTFQYPFPIAYYPQFPEVIRYHRVDYPRVTEPFAECSRHSDLHGLIGLQ